MLWAYVSLTLPSDRPTLESCLQFCLWPLSARGPLDPDDYFGLFRAVDGTHCHHHPALCCVQTLWDCTLQAEAWPVLGHPGLLAHPYVHSSACSTPRCYPCSNRIYVLWEISDEKFSQIFRALRVKHGGVINLCRITGLCHVKMCKPENRNVCTQLNRLTVQVLDP